VTIQRKCLFVDIGSFQLHDSQLKMIVMMIKTQVHRQEICKIRVQFSLKKEMLTNIVVSKNFFSIVLMLIGKLNLYSHPIPSWIMVHREYLMVSLTVLAVLVYNVQVATNQWSTLKLTIPMCVVIHAV
jgi:hypothetical protein